MITVEPPTIDLREVFVIELQTVRNRLLPNQSLIHIVAALTEHNLSLLQDASEYQSKPVTVAFKIIEEPVFIVGDITRFEFLQHFHQQPHPHPHPYLYPHLHPHLHLDDDDDEHVAKFTVLTTTKPKRQKTMSQQELTCESCKHRTPNVWDCRHPNKISGRGTFTYADSDHTLYNDACHLYEATPPTPQTETQPQNEKRAFSSPLPSPLPHLSQYTKIDLFDPTSAHTNTEQHDAEANELYAQGYHPGEFQSHTRPDGALVTIQRFYLIPETDEKSPTNPET